MPDDTEQGHAHRLRQDVVPEIRGSILAGQLKPGSKIIESRLAASLGISRTPLREALLHLEREGLVRSDLRRGFTVEPLSPREVRETYPVLATLECYAVRTNAAFVSPLLPDLERLNVQFRRASSAQRALELDTRWHDTLTSPSNNSRLAGLMASLRRAIRRYELIYMSDVALLPTSAAQHNAIIDALKKNDTKVALEAIEANYVLGMHVLLRKMGEE
ncbi:MAG: GntR family transcriptional regulator [Silvibacterium sp.]